MKMSRLPRTLGLWSSVGLVVGITIGSGIFRTPAGIARLLPQPQVMLAAWVLGGLVTLCGALSFAGLGRIMPETGGFYVYLREGWGRPVAFLFGWSELVLIRANALGGMSIVFGEYGLRSFGVDPIAHPFAARGLAAAAIGCAAVANIRGARVGAAIVGWSTGTKFIALALLVGCSLVLGGAHGASIAHFQTILPTGPAGSAASSLTAGSLGLALVSILWAYDGFADVSFAGGEVKDPRRNLPRAIIVGTLAIIGLYVLTNVAYLYVLPIDVIGRSPLVAADVMETLFGKAGAALVSLIVMISSFSSVNGSMLAAPRVFYAMAADGLFFKVLARVHPRFHTPHIAILLSAMLGMALVMSRSFEALTNTFVLAIWPFYALSVAAIFRMRRLRPDLGPHGVLGYPIVPAVFIAAVAWFVLNALVTDPISTSATFALILAGLPIFVIFFRKHVQ
jgi:amino acid transporter